MIEVRNIGPKARISQGVAVQPYVERNTYHADIEPGKSIRLHGVHQGKPFDVSFKLGDPAEYDSYNLKYLGEIIKITANTVTINGKSTGVGNKRLSLYEFSWRNYDFNLDKISSQNHETMMTI